MGKHRVKKGVEGVSFNLVELYTPRRRWYGTYLEPKN